MRSLRRRLLLAIGLATSAAFLVAGALVHVLVRGSLMDQLDDNLIARGAAMSALVEQESEGLESELASAVTVDGDTMYFMLLDGAGHVIARSPNLGGRDLVPTQTTLATIELPGGSSARQLTLHFVPRFDEPIEAPQRATLVVARGTASVDDAVGRISLVLIGAGIAGTLACLLASLWLVRFGLGPVRALADRIALIRETELSARLRDTSTPDELRPIVDRLDDLLARVAGAFARERELTAEVAHELRTPISGLRATIEVALDRERSAERYRAALQDCHGITLQTERMVASMLQLARLDAGTLAASRTDVDLDELVRDVLATHSARANERGLCVTSDIEPVRVTTDREHMRVIVQNLVDNAVTYADAGGRLDLTLRGGELRVTNSGCTLDPADAARVFDRFWRGDSARSGGGAGLGLPLCKKLVGLLGGTITVAITTGTFVATVALPAKRTASPD